MYDELTNCAEITSSVTSFLSSEGVTKVGVTVVAATFAGFDAKLPILIGILTECNSYDQIVAPDLRIS